MKIEITIPALEGIVPAIESLAAAIAGGSKAAPVEAVTEVPKKKTAKKKTAKKGSHQAFMLFWFDQYAWIGILLSTSGAIALILGIV